MVVREATLEDTDHGVVCKGSGWFVVNAREVRWYESEGWGNSEREPSVSEIESR